MLALIAAIFVASVLGSLHCAGMCGAFVAVAAGAEDRGWRRQSVLQGAYHLGRLVTYTMLGAAAGAVGRLTDLAGALAGLRPLAAILAGATMLVFGLVALLRSLGVRMRSARLPGFWNRFVQKLFGRFVGGRDGAGRSPIARAMSIGLLTTLLPCGWLYAFAVTAAGTGSAWLGALAMTAFWAGTLPMLVALGAGVRRVVGPLGRRLPAVTASLIIVAGLYTLAGRMLIDPVALAGRVQPRDAAAAAAAPVPTSAPCCKHHDVAP